MKKELLVATTSGRGWVAIGYVLTLRALLHFSFDSVSTFTTIRYVTIETRILYHETRDVDATCFFQMIVDLSPMILDNL